MIRLRCLLATLIAVSGVLAPDSGHAAEGYFERQVAPIFARHCLKCHNDENQQGDFSIQSAAAVRESGHLVQGDVNDSRLLEVLVSDGSDPPQMPKDAPPLEPQEVAAIRNWIARGAEWPPGVVLRRPSDDFDWWSFQPLSPGHVPGDRAASHEVATAIDAYLQVRREHAGVKPSVEADRVTLIRRLTFDLLGLPPTPAEVDRFVADAEPLAYERLVDRLLASPHYGERWGRHWLDVVKYADTCGYDKDKLRPNAWPYRDYVIRAFNDDKPYARFVREQLAGDVLYPGEPDGILALGFLAAGPWDFIGHCEVPESKLDGQVARNLDRDEMVTNTLNTFTSLTVQCARCHDHKFDPVKQHHYYSLQAVFAAVDRAERPYGLSADDERRYQEVIEQLGTTAQEKQTLEAKLSQIAGPRLFALEGQIAQLRGKEGDNRNELRKLHDERNSLADRELLAAWDSSKKSLADLQAELDSMRSGPLVYAAATHFPVRSQFRPTLGKPRTIHVLQRGNIEDRGDEVRPGTVSWSRGDKSIFQLSSGHSEADRRAAMAKWLTRHDHPLTWRSIVNRVWQHHFGKGIVESPNDFGKMGQRPSHPELLDWLAIELRDGGQSIKRLHRKIVTSAVYRQVSSDDRHNAERDGDNRLLWKMNRRRLSAEEIRDSILAASGQLNATMGGKGFYLFVLEKTQHSPHYEYHKFDPLDAASHRRSVYRFVVRSQPDPYMTTLDCADSSQSTPRRIETLTSLQALSLLNSKFNLALARLFAERLEESTDELAGQIDLAFRLALGRPPLDDELAELTRFSQQHGLANVCRMIFNLSEFVFVD